MVFIDAGRTLLTTLRSGCQLAGLCVLLLLAGCAGLTERINDMRARPAAALAPEGEMAIDGEPAPIIRIPDPYLALNVTVPTEAQQLFRQAVAALESEDYRTAERVCRQMLEAYPTLSGAYVNLGIALWRQSRIEPAADAFRQAIKVNKVNTDAYNQYGIMLREQGQFEEAEKIYRQALDVWPHSPAALRNLGILYDLYMGRHDQALQHYELLQRVLPEPSREIEGWIIDLKRRISETAA